MDQVKLVGGNTFRWKNSDCRFHIGTCPSIWESGGKRASGGDYGVKTRVRHLYVTTSPLRKRKVPVTLYVINLSLVFVMILPELRYIAFLNIKISVNVFSMASWAIYSKVAFASLLPAQKIAFPIVKTTTTFLKQNHPLESIKWTSICQVCARPTS